MGLPAVNEEVLKSFIFWAGIMLIKTMAMSALTTFSRWHTLVFCNEEDTEICNSMGGILIKLLQTIAGAPKKGKPEVRFDNSLVERVRRCHRNDLENVYSFILIGFLYVLTDPSATRAIWHFRIFGISRILHTFVYLGGRQPGRAIFCHIGYFVAFAMVIRTVLAVL